MKPFTYLDFLAYMGVGNAHPGGFELTKKLIEEINPQPNAKILDVGCGTGITAAYIAANYGCTVTAMDLHPEMLKKAERRFKEDQVTIELLKANAEQLPFSSKTFDIVLTESVTAFTTIQQSLREYQRVLKEDGYLMAIEMTGENNLTDEEKQDIQNLYGMNEILTEQQWVQELQKSGFHEIEILYAGNPQQYLKSPDDYMPIFEPSERLDSGIYNLWAEHELLILKYQTKLGHRAFRAAK